MCRLIGRVSCPFSGKSLEATKPHSIGSESFGSHPQGECPWASVDQSTRGRITRIWPDLSAPRLVRQGA